MIIAYVLTSFIGEGTQENPFVPEVFRDYPDGQIKRCTDVTGQDMYPDPNLLTVRVVCEAIVLDDIESNPKHYVISSEELI